MNENQVKCIIERLIKEYRKICRPTIFSLVALLACYCSLHTLSNQICLLERVIYYVLVYIGAQNILTITSEMRNCTGAFDKCLIVLLCVIADFAVTGSYYLEPIYDNTIVEVPYFLLSLFWISIVVLYLLSSGLRYINRKYKNKEYSISKKANIIMVSICIIVCAVCNYAFNPAITSPDSHYAYSMALHLGEQPVLDGHPVFYLILLRIISFFSPNIRFMIFVQVVFYALITVKGINLIARLGVPAKICIFLFIFVGMGFSTIIQLITLWKDIPYVTSLLWLTILLVQMCSFKKEYSEKKSWYVQLYFAVLFTSLIRHNGILAAVVSLVALNFLIKKEKKIIITTFILVVSYILIKGPIYSYFNVSPEVGAKYYALTNDLLYLYYYDDIADDEQIMQVVNDATNNDPENFGFNAYYTLNIARENLQHYSTKEFCGIYVHAFIEHPSTMIKAVMTRNVAIWSVDKTEGEVGGCVNYLDEYKDPTFWEQYPDRVPNVFTSILTKFFTWLTSIKFIYTLYWKAGIYHLLLFGCVILLLLVRRVKRIFILPFMPAACNIVLLFIASGWSDYRYYWPSMLVTVVLIPYTVFIARRSS